MAAFRCTLFFAMAVEVVSNTCPAIPTVPTTPDACQTKRTGWCASNAVSSEDVQCGTDEEYKAGAALTKSQTVADCCRKNTCSGNTADSNDVACPAGQKLIAASGTTEKSTTTDCCVDKTGYCTDNALATDNYACTGTGYVLFAHGATLTGNSDAACCGKTCSAWTEGQDGSKATDVCQTSEGKEIDSSKANGVLPESSKSSCCKPLYCCGSTSPVTCDANRMLETFARILAQGAGAAAVKEANCCTDIIKDRCSGNSLTADVACGTNQRNKGGAGTTVAVCCEDTCKGQVTCPTGKTNRGLLGLSQTTNLDEANCCSDNFVDKCTGNTDTSTDVTCNAGTKLRGLAMTTDVKDKSDTAKQAECCEVKTKYCTDNKVASENVDCSTCADKTDYTCTAKADATIYANDASKCASCCEQIANADIQGSTTGAHEAAALSSAALAAMGAIWLF